MKTLDEFLDEIENAYGCCTLNHKCCDHLFKSIKIIREMKLCIEFYKNINFFGNTGTITENNKEPAKITLFAIDKILNEGDGE